MEHNILPTLSGIQSSQFAADSEKKSFTIILYYIKQSIVFSSSLLLKTLHGISALYLYLPTQCLRLALHLKIIHHNILLAVYE